MEAWAIIGAHLIPRTLHVGVGNSCALSHLANILRGATGTWKKPWGMRPDGDVWAILECIVDARGQGATKCSKDKGHATDEDVRLGRVSVVDKAGNDIADRMVHKGYAMASDGVPYVSFTNNAERSTPPSSAKSRP